ncbi:MAG: type II secretion system F family protein [Candidatus Micrarchaeota archaeon]
MSSGSIFESVGRLLFTRGRIKSLEKELNIAGVDMPADSFAGYVSLNVIVATIVLTALALIYAPLTDSITGLISEVAEVPFALVAILALIGSFLLVYLATMGLVSSYLLMKAEDRRKRLEAALPDFLTLVQSNIKAGMALDQAMWYSAKPEFGLLSDEVKAVIKSSFSGESLETTLDTLSSRFDSKVFKRTILLLKQATATGGELTEVLERTADDVRGSIIMKKEIAATLILYEIFVLFAAVVGTPFLFAVASKLISVFEKIAPQAGSVPSGAAGPFGGLSAVQFVGPVISSTDFFWFSVPTIFVTALISSFMVSIIRTGAKEQGMKYLPFVLGGAFFVYWLVINIVESLFAAIG